MVFSSLIFLFRFLPLVLLIYYIAPRNCRNLILFVASLIFYAWGEPVYVVLILFSTIVDYVAGRRVSYYKVHGNLKRAKCAVLSSVVINLSLLGFFKYANFIIETINAITPFDFMTPDLALPIGISFYTFQTMSYTIDIYRGDAKVQKNFISFGAYVALFPQLIAGPIVRYKTIAGQLDNRRENADVFSEGVLRFITGLGKKVLIANQLGIVWQELSTTLPEHLSTGGAWLGIIAFTLQIYFDFSGYSDMAIGLGKMFGFHFLENFNYPYESKSITEFWRRWHISLGTWFREYVYIPLGGNRKGLKRQMINLLAVWLLTGLWHGAYWNFVLWGIYYGVLLVLEKFVLLKWLKKLPSFVGRIYTLFFVTLGWAVFSWNDMTDSKAYMSAMFGGAVDGIWNSEATYLLLSYGFIFIIAIVGSTSLAAKTVKSITLLKKEIPRAAFSIIYMLVVLCVSVALLVNSSYNPFLYFRF